MDSSHIEYKIIKIAICDDDSTFMRILCRKLKHILMQRGIHPEISCFDDPEKLLKEAAENPAAYSTYFLDIEMPVKRGTTVAHELRRIYETSKILFITSHSEEVLNAFHYRADAFVPKSMLDERLPTEIDLILDSIKAGEMEGPIFFQVEAHTEGGNRMIPLLIRLRLQDILYFESINKKVVLHAIGAEYTLKGVRYHQIRNQFLRRGFVDTHRTLLVNFEHIKAVAPNEVLLDIGDERLHLSRRMHNRVVIQFMEIMEGVG